MSEANSITLPEKGKPIDLDAYFSTPEDVRMGYSILKANNFVPEEVELLREIADLKAQLADCPEDTRKLELIKAIRDKSLALTLILEKAKRKR